jgi:hypothetical protein
LSNLVDWSRSSDARQPAAPGGQRKTFSTYPRRVSVREAS